jgi:hypothetical protein
VVTGGRDSNASIFLERHEMGSNPVANEPSLSALFVLIEALTIVSH